MALRVGDSPTREGPDYASGKEGKEDLTYKGSKRKREEETREKEKRNGKEEEEETVGKTKI